MIDAPHSAGQPGHRARDLGLAAALGLGAFVAYRYLANVRTKRHHGDQVRRSVQCLKDRVDQWLAEGVVGNYLDPISGRDDADADGDGVERQRYAQDELPGYGEGRDPQGRGRQPAPQPDYDVSALT